MIRGISKRIIEVNDTESEYFEKALFFVKPESDMSDVALKNEADKIISSYFFNIIPPERGGYLRTNDMKKSKRVLKLITALICMGLAIGLGIALKILI